MPTMTGMQPLTYLLENHAMDSIKTLSENFLSKNSRDNDSQKMQKTSLSATSIVQNLWKHEIQASKTKQKQSQIVKNSQLQEMKMLLQI